jgi:hypothetical protein
LFLNLRCDQFVPQRGLDPEQLNGCLDCLSLAGGLNGPDVL